MILLRTCGAKRHRKSVIFLVRFFGQAKKWT